MPNPTQALLAFGKLIAFFDDNGVVQFAWFGDPLDLSLLSMPEHRDRLHDLLQSILQEGPSGQKPPFPLAGLEWEPINLGSSVGVGFAWNAGGKTDPLRLGLGAAANFPVGGQSIDLAVLARLLTIQNGDIAGDLPGFVFGGKIPVPDFLHSASLQGEVPNPTQVGLTVNADASNARTLTIPGPQLAWDSVRLAVFILQAWVRDQTTGGDTFFDRIDKHLFPIFGGPPGGPIAPFPFFGAANMGQAPDFDPWVDSVLKFDGGAQGALTCLWHLRALLTGNESSSFLDGSLFFPIDEPPSAGSLPSLADSAGSLAPTTPGAFLGIEEDALDGNKLQLVIRLQNGQSKLTIPLAKSSGGTLTRPNLLDNPANLSSYPLPGWMSASGTNPTKLTLFSETLTATAGFGGPLKFDLLLTQGLPVGYEITLPTTPPLGLAFPPTGGGPIPSPNTPEQAFDEVLSLIAAASSGTPAQDIVAALQSILSAAIRNQSPDPQAIVAAILAAVGDQDALELGDLFVIDLESGAVVQAELKLDKVAEALKDSPVRIGKAGLDAKLSLANAEPLQSVKFRLEDVRIDPSGAGAGGVAGALLGDMTEAPGFSLAVEWQPPDKIIPSGGGQIPIQQTIGPLELSTLYVEVDQNALEIALDAAFTLGPVSVTPYELGVRIPFSNTAPTPFLHGLGLSMDVGGIKLAGHFAEIDNDYVGAAVVSVVDFFELSAIGGYTKLPNDSESLFLFASLVAPLGGPPYLFITGIAGGFGYNRLLPPPGPISDNPFMRVMRGEIALGGGPSEALKTLGKQFLPAQGQNWIAAGVQFLSFGFIQGKLVVVIGFPSFSLQILGSAAFGINPVAYFELEIQATANQEVFELIAGLSHNSYVIHPDIFSLHGQFGLAAWHSGQHAGDFVFSIGGYHNSFPVPEHYPQLDRVGVTATVYGFIKMSVQCYFATTPQAMMAGASVSLSAEFAGIGAGLDVYIDVYIQWDPFFIQGRLGVVVWFEFMGRHEIGVKLEIHTPPLGGVATIDLLLVSFDIEFGDQLNGTPPLPIPDFFEKQLGVESDPWSAEGARVAALSTADRAGLFRLDLLWGRTAKAESESDAQEGVSASDPIRVGSEFAFSVRTRLPLGAIQALVGPFPPNAVSISSSVDLPLCPNADDLDSTLRIEGPQVGQALPALLDDAFPAAQFGAEIQVAQPDSFAKALIGQVKTDEAVVDLTEGLSFTYLPKFEPAEAKDWDILTTEEPSLGDERYPLPLAAPSRTLTLRAPKPQLILGAGGRVFKAPSQRPSLTLNRKLLVRERIQARVAKPLQLAIRSVTLDRPTKLAALAGSGFATRPANIPVVTPPPSPVRRIEMRDIALRTVPPRVPAAPRPTIRPVAVGLRPSLTLAKSVRLPLQRVGARDQSQAQVTTGEAVHLEMAAERAVRGSLTLKGAQIVRAVFLGTQGQPVADLYLPANHSGPIPPRARQAVFFGEGVAAPVAPARPVLTGAAGPARAVEAVGVELDSLLTALSARSFAGHGCVVEASSSVGEPVAALDPWVGADLLRAAPNMRVHFPAVPPNGTLVVYCEPVGGEAEPDPTQIRWRSLDAELGSLLTVTRPDRLALTMAVRADEPWTLDVDLGPQWRLCAAVWRPQSQRETFAWLSSSAHWDMTDDRQPEPARPATSTLDLDFEA
ncbi:MAG: hypothetical protein GC160_01470 [Acidobacteria bacterium]|nr:hypothetical protein [Acidobacteriota bacterium]